MQKPDVKGFFLCIFWQMFLYAVWSVPAWILLILHFAVGVPLRWFWIALGAWFVVMLLRTLLIGAHGGQLLLQHARALVRGRHQPLQLMDT